MKNLSLFTATLILLWFSPWLATGQSCPKGIRYNCVHGCGRHTDLNKDGFCDYSIVTLPEKDETKVSPPKDSVKALSADTHSVAVPESGGRNLSISDIQEHPEVVSGEKTSGEKAKGNARRLSPDITNPASDQPVPSAESPAGVSPPLAPEFVPSHREPVYDLIFVSIITLLLYFATMILYRENIIKRIHHRKFWNLMLLLTFLVSCLFGLFLVIQINYNVAMKAYGTLLYWHVEIGIAMTLVAIIHILWHLTYFKNMLKKW